MGVKGKAADRRPKAAKAKAVPARPKQPSLPEMDDRSFQDLDNKAHEYAEVRDERMALTEREVALRGELLELMHKHKKQDYVYQEVEIHVVKEDEKVRVKIHRDKEDVAA